ncbi:MAG: hypothetical protein ACP5KS_14665, partial [Candidatus Hydrogenedens sp.]
EKGMQEELHVQDVWRCILYAKRYGDESWARYCYKDIQKYIENLSKEQIRTAMEQCPYYLDIPKLFYTAREIFG